MNNMKKVKVIFADPKYNYKTDCSALASDESIRNYFVGKRFNLAPYSDTNEVEDMKTCINVKIL